MKFAIYNLGCKVNAYEAEAVSEEMIHRGWQRVNENEKADAAIIFTCAVTNTAASKSRKTLHQMIHHQDGITAVAGCYAQIDDGLLDDADIIVGTAHKRLIPDYIEQFQQNHQKIRDIQNLQNESFETLPIDHLENHSRGVLKIQDGCNQYCTFCIIPFARGHERSLDPDAAVKEAAEIAKHHSEIVLTGIHTGRYGREYQVTLAALMKRMLKEVPFIQRLRLSSIEINEVTDELLELMHDDNRIARHLHIPLQAGSDSVLAAMHRPYTTKMYYDRVEQIRKIMPDVAISCDIMVGFPGESDEQFEETCAFLKKCQFSFLHVFPFSARSGTAASRMPDQVDPVVKKKRAAICLDLSKELKHEYDRTWVGRTVEIITEKPHSSGTPGYTSQYIRGLIPGRSYPRGTRLKGKVLSYQNDLLEIGDIQE